MSKKTNSYRLVPVGEFLREDVETVDPRNNSEEVFDLWSIPAHDNGRPEVVTGAQVGSHKKLVKPGDILLSKIVPHIQRSRVVFDSINNSRIIASTEWIVFSSTLVNPLFLREVLTSEFFHRRFMETITGVGGSLARANPKAVSKIKIPLPPLAEQRKIAEILRTWDEAIETAEAELKAKQERKRWLMDKAFCSNIACCFGNSVLLGSIAKLIKGKKPELHDNYSEGAKPYLVAKYIRGDEKPKYAFLSDKNAVSISPTDIVIICDGSNSGEMFSGLDGVLSSTMAKLYLTSGEFEQAYVQFFVAYNGDKLTDAQEGGAIPHLDRDKLLKLNLLKRTKEEQLKTIEVLNSSHDSITNVEQRLELLHAQKRGLIQKLLTGDIPVMV